MTNNEYYPTSTQYIACGSIGIILFFILLFIAIFLLVYKTPKKNKDSFYFYICISVMSICELPRYFDMVADGTYNCKVCYSFHIIADLFYFICLAIVILTFVHILELGPLTSVFYTRCGMTIAVAVQAVINFCAYVYCLNSSSLERFFTSTMYSFFTVFDIVQNFLYTAVLSFHGVRLVLRFRNYNTFSASTTEQGVFQAIIRKVTLILLFVTLFSLSRFVILVAKLVIASKQPSDTQISSPSFPVYGVVWFLFSDYLPRAATSIALCFLMQTDRVDAPRADGSSHKVLHERRESSDAPLSADESGIASGGHKQLYIDSQNDKYDNRHDSELTNYHKPLFSEVRINDDEVVL